MSTKTGRAGQNPPIVARIALLLTILAVATTPMAFSKYKATGMGSAKARVAMWDPKVANQANQNPVTGLLASGDVTVLVRTTTNHAVPFYYDNSTTEVMTNYDIWSDHAGVRFGNNTSNNTDAVVAPLAALATASDTITFYGNSGTASTYATATLSWAYTQID